MNSKMKNSTDRLCSGVYELIENIINSNATMDKKIIVAQGICKNLQSVFDIINVNVTLLTDKLAEIEEEGNIHSKDFMYFFNSIKYRVVEFGYYGCEELNYMHPLNNQIITALACLKKDELGVKSKYWCNFNNLSNFYLKDLKNYDVLENIKLFDSNNNQYNFSIEICKDNVKNDQENIITNDKTIPIFSLYNYKIIIFDKPDNINDFILKSTGYSFISEVRKQIVKFF